MSAPFADACCGAPPEPVVARARAVRLLALDVDGVLTDGSVYVAAGGESFKRFHIQDGKGLAMLRDEGLDLAVITARRSEAMARRAAELGIRHLQQGCTDKAAALAELRARLGLDAEQSAFVGDDLVDLGAMAGAGLAVAVADAHPRVRRAAHWVTGRPGGQGAVREVCELILGAQQRLQGQFARHLHD